MARPPWKPLLGTPAVLAAPLGGVFPSLWAGHPKETSVSKKIYFFFLSILEEETYQPDLVWARSWARSAFIKSCHLLIIKGLNIPLGFILVATFSLFSTLLLILAHFLLIKNSSKTELSLLGCLLATKWKIC